jgi:DNA-binding Xre family transcriptional regulator
MPPHKARQVHVGKAGGASHFLPVRRSKALDKISGFHSRYYPDMDSGVKPHMDTRGIDNGPMTKTINLRSVLAANLARRMEAVPACDTQSKLAERAGMAQSHVSRILRRESAATVDMLESISKALGCMPWELLADNEEARREALSKMILGPAAADSRVSAVLPIPPKAKRKAKK